MRLLRRAIAVALSALLAASPSGAQTRSFLKTGQYLKVNEYLLAENKAFFAIMQGDGNFAVYKGSGPSDNRGRIFDTRRDGAAGSYYAIMQGDGNFAVNKGTGPESNLGNWWHTNVTATGGQFYVVIENDGNLTTFKGNGPGAGSELVWRSWTGTAVTWSHLGKKIYNKSYAKPVWYGFQGRTQLWAAGGDPSKAPKWVFMPDGTIRDAANLGMCWGHKWDPRFHPPGKWVEVDYQYCDGRWEQAGWAFEGKRITKSNFPSGPQYILYTDGSGNMMISPHGDLAPNHDWYNEWYR